jgi:hypothetical protein
MNRLEKAAEKWLKPYPFPAWRENVDVLLVVSDPSMRGLVTAARMKDLIAELRTKVGRIAWWSTGLTMASPRRRSSSSKRMPSSFRMVVSWNMLAQNRFWTG